MTYLRTVTVAAIMATVSVAGFTTTAQARSRLHPLPSRMMMKKHAMHGRMMRHRMMMHHHMMKHSHMMK